MGFIDYEVDGQVGIITINRPKALNALNSEVLKDLDTIVFDKTGTLTKAKPTVKEVIVFGVYYQVASREVASLVADLLGASDDSSPIFLQILSMPVCRR